MKDNITDLVLEDILFKQLCNLQLANTILTQNNIINSPNFIKILNNYNKGTEIIFDNLANTRKIKEY